MRSKLKIMPEYQCSPIWIENSDQMFENILIESMEISDELKQRLQQWDKSFQLTFNDLYPPDSGFPSKIEEKAFEKDGHALYIQLIGKLGSDYEIVYQPF